LKHGGGMIQTPTQRWGTEQRPGREKKCGGKTMKTTGNYKSKQKQIAQAKNKLLRSKVRTRKETRRHHTRKSQISDQHKQDANQNFPLRTKQSLHPKTQRSPPSLPHLIGIKTKSCSWHTSTLDTMKMKLGSDKEPHPL
jgi:hypothetical protein